jgi:hypothetical protein
MSNPIADLIPSRGAVSSGARAAAVGIGVLFNLGSALLIVGTLGACFHAVPLFAIFGVNALDYVGLADLPLLGLRNLTSVALALALVLVLAWSAATGALKLRRAEERYNELKTKLEGATWHERFGELLIPWVLARNVALPVVTAGLAGWIWLATVSTALNVEAGLLQSERACTYSVTWKRGLVPRRPRQSNGASPATAFEPRILPHREPRNVGVVVRRSAAAKCHTKALRCPLRVAAFKQPFHRPGVNYRGVDGTTYSAVPARHRPAAPRRRALRG